MVFSSLVFTFYFLPLVVGAYYLAKEKYRNYLLLVASIFFYSYGEPRFVFVMLLSILLNYVLAIAIDYFRKKKITCFILVLDIIVNIGIIIIFKYLDFMISVSNHFLRTSFNLRGIALPIGISFFTFQALSYVIDVYRGKVEVQKNLLYLALYISFFPQLVAGPIVRYSTIAGQIVNRSINIEKFGEGIRRFVLGFSKKIILSNNLSLLVEDVFKMDVSTVNPFLLWIGSICFSLQIYYDFSGYSDMAIGLGKIFGFDFEENFNYPYISKSVTEFWHRWHMSLGQWFRDYVYIPLGGSKVSVPRHVLNMFIVWALTGIWHGANYTFIAWGIGYFILLVLEKYFIKPEKRKALFVRISWEVITLLMINFGWVIFNSADLLQGIKYCLGMVGWYQISFCIDVQVLRYIREYGVFILLGIIFATPIANRLRKILEDRKLRVIVDGVLPCCYAIIFLWSVSYLILGAHNPFIYFNF